MPGYILHLTEAEMVCGLLREKGIRLSQEWMEAFRLGNLLPDTKRKGEKVTSHFWNPQELANLAIAPDLGRFETAYGDQLEGPLMAGYYTHLHLDERYVKSFWPTLWQFLGPEGEEEILREKIRCVYLKGKELRLPVERFFSGEYYYGDYSRMNGRILKKYGLTLPQYQKLDCPIREVDPKELKTVLEELKMLAERAQETEEELRVFSMESLEAFIRETAEIAVGKMKFDGKNGDTVRIKPGTDPEKK